MEWQYEVSFMAVPDELENILDWTKEKARSLLTEKRAQMRMCLALEEAVVNVVKYAYSDCEREPVLIIRMKLENNTLVVQMQDQGVQFNPVENIVADPNLKLFERKQGGWGRAIMVGFTDKSSYRYEEPYNILTLEKKNEAEVILNNARVKKS